MCCPGGGQGQLGCWRRGERKSQLAGRQLEPPDQHSLGCTRQLAGDGPGATYTAVLELDLQLPTRGPDGGERHPRAHHALVVSLVRLGHPPGHGGVGGHLGGQVEGGLPDQAQAHHG